MAGSINMVILLGNVGGDPEIRRTNDGRPIASFSLATSEQWRDKNSGERREKTEWHNIVVFAEGICKVVEQYVSKGSKVQVFGKMQTRKWEDKDGKDRYTTEVVLNGFDAKLILLGDKGEGGGSRRNDRDDERRGGDDYGSRSRGDGRRNDRGGDRRDDRGQMPRDFDDSDIPF